MIKNDISKLLKFSHFPVTVECDFKSSDKCKNIWINMLSAVNIVRDRNDGKDICNACAGVSKRSGKNSIHFKYPKNENFFEDIATELQAYLLGWIASDGHVARNRIIVKLKTKDKEILEVFRDALVPTGHISDAKNDCSVIYINSFKLVKDICKILKISPGPKDRIVSMPDFKNDELSWAFIRGYFEGDGYIQKYEKNKMPRIVISSISEQVKKDFEFFLSKFNISSYSNSRSITIYGSYCLMLIDKIYNNPSEKLSRKHEQCMLWKTNWRPLYSVKLNIKDALEIKKLYNTKEYSLKKLAAMYGVGRTTIESIIKNRIKRLEK